MLCSYIIIIGIIFLIINTNATMPKNTLEIPVNVFLCLLRGLTFDRDSSDGNHGVRKICTLG